MNNIVRPTPVLIVLSAVLALSAFLLVLNLWIVVAFRQPSEMLTPWLWFAPPKSWPMINKEAFDNALNAALISGVGLFGACIYYAATPPGVSAYGDARWARRHEIAKAGLLDANGVILGKLSGPKGWGSFIRSTRDAYSNTLLVAPPGGGKGVGVVIPTLLTWPGSAVVLDMKGENFEATAGARQKMGDTVFVLSPYDKTGNTHRFNPLLAISKLEDADDRFTELRRIATYLLTSRGKADEPFIEGARDLFTATASVVVMSETPTLGEVLRRLAPDENALGSGSMSGVFKRLALEADHASAKTTLLQYAAYDQETIATFLSVLRSAGLGAWGDPAVDRATSANDFDLGALRSKPQCIYIVIRPNDMEALAPLARLFFQTVTAALQENLPTKDDLLPVLLLLDEFKSLGKMESLLNAATTIRGYGGRMLIVVQGIPNLEEVYGQSGAQGLMNACQVHAYMSINDPKTKAMLSRSLGNTEVEIAHESISRSFGRGGHSRTSSTQRRGSPLISEDGISRLGEDTILILPQNARPIRARKVKYYADRSLKQLVVDYVENAHGEIEGAPKTASAGSNDKWGVPAEWFVKDNAYQQTADYITFMIGLRAEAEPILA